MLRAVEFFKEDHEFLLAASAGNIWRLKEMIKQGVDVQMRDYLGRNGLHMAVTSGNENTIITLLNAGVNATVKDSLGMTPLLLCLMRRPNLKMVKLLFAHGVKILPREHAMDTGLFIQFVMMCIPNEEEEKILHYLVEEQGAMVDDPDAPGDRQALHFAAMSNNCALIRILIELGADPFLVNHRNETSREVALRFRCIEAAEIIEKFEKKLIQRPSICGKKPKSHWQAGKSSIDKN